MSKYRLAPLALVPGWLAVACPAFAAPPASTESSTPLSVHAAEMERHRDEVVTPRAFPASRPRAERLAGGRVVYGYLPYWSNDLANVRLDLLTHLSWFAIDMNASGVITAKHGWPDATTVDTAHAAKVRVDLAFTLFSGSGIKALVTDPAARKTAVGNMIDAMEEGSADGISVDFEGFTSGTRDGFVTFIAELRSGLDARGHDDAQITLAGPAVDWGDEWDVPTLLDSADYFFIMGYDLFWSGSSHAGPSGIFRISEPWRAATSWSGLRSVATWASRVGKDKRKQILYGVPLYGSEYTTTGGGLAAAATGSVGSVTYTAARAALAGGKTRLWDDGAKTPWYAWQSGGVWRETYYDDEESLRFKYQLAIDEGIGGVGMWALGYDAGHTELWDTLVATIGTRTPAPLGHRDAPIAIAKFPFHDARDTSKGPSQYFNFYKCAPDVPEYGKEWVYAIDVCQPGTLTAHVEPGAANDPDLHLLSDAFEEACLARDGADLSSELKPGRYLVVVDTFVDRQVELEGPYALDVDFTPKAGTKGCADGLVCAAGACVCPDAAETLCDGKCVDLTRDDRNCGACGNACDDDASCHAGACATSGDGGGGQGGQASGAVTVHGDASCSCRTAARQPPTGALAGLALLAALTLRRRRDPA